MHGKHESPETQEHTLERLEQNRTRIASMRASETLHVKLHKRRKNKEAMANARTRTVLIESAIAAFHSEVKLGPEFVCTCCYYLECVYVIIFFTIVFKTNVVYIETLCHILVPHLLILICSF